MKKTITLFVILIFSTTLHAQVKEYSVSDLLQYLNNHKDNLFEVFETVDRNDCMRDLSDTIVWFQDVKGAYYSDTLKNILLSVFIDSVGRANYEAMRTMRRYYQNEEKFVRKSLKAKGVSDIDSIMLTPNLYTHYKDSLFEERRLSYFNYCLNTNNIPWSLTNLISKIRYPEAYEYICYRWKKSGCGRNDEWYEALYNYQSPVIFGDLEKLADSYNPQYSEELCELVNIARSGTRPESYLYAMKLLDKTYLVFNGTGRIPVNMYIMSSLGKEYAYAYYCEHEHDISYPAPLDYEERFAETAWSVSVYDYEILKPIATDSHGLPVYSEKEMIQLVEDKILANIDYLKSFLKKKYESFVDADLYWKRNMPYYKGEEK